MKRKIIHIDEEKCIGCGACASTCHQGAIQLIDGKAKLVREDHCDGLGRCLPKCPADAISLIEVETESAAAKESHAHASEGERAKPDKLPCGCPGTNLKMMDRSAHEQDECAAAHEREHACGIDTREPESELTQWPVQIKLLPPNAACFQNARLLVAADCTAYAYANFHKKFIKNHITLIGCPKLDEGDYSEKLTEILLNNDIKSITVVRMEVPCCGGIENAVKTALVNSGKLIPWQVAVISTDGKILD